MTQRVLSFHYTLTDAQGKQLDSSRGRDPLSFLEGSRMILPALEKELFKLNVGVSKKIELKAADAYGQVNEELKTKVKRAQLPGDKLEVGFQFQTGPETGNRIFMVTRIEGDDVYLDGNHPLAGMDLSFEVEVMELREATEEELSGSKKDCCNDPDCDK